jgi:hypothetical protein
MSDVTFVLSRARSREGIDYTIGVYRRPEGYFAYWECPQCQDQGSHTESVADLNSAIRECEQQIERHHAENHAVIKV